MDAKPTDDEPEEVTLADLVKPLWTHRRFLVLLTLGSTILAVIFSGVHYLSQPVRWTVSLEFSPIFQGADAGRYPNGLRFGPSDITDPSVLDQVFDANKLQDFCPRNDFRSAFFTELSSSELQMIDSDYQFRLADARLTAVDRQRLQDEYRSRRAAAPIQYALTFIRPASCQTLPAAVAIKALDDVLLTWARDSDAKRGVLRQRVRVFTPAVFDDASFGQQSLFVRANLVWTSLDRVIRNITEVQALPGTEQVRLVDQRTAALAEVKAKMEDLQHSYLESLMTSVGAEHDRDSLHWVEEALATATSQQQVAQNRARANLDALREYSGVAPQPIPSRADAQRAQGSVDVQSLAPQIDRTFIDRILEMSAANTTFRQELTRAIVKSSLEAVESETIVNHYKQLYTSLKSGGTGSASLELGSRLSEIVTEAKRLTTDFDALYEEWSRVAFRPGPLIYRTERPAAVETVQSFSKASYLAPVALVFLVSLTLGILGVLIRARL